ncbi:CocE/NonD family hydrolase [Nocardia sp. 2]|uniref:CocE/NonD family hydrolase n=1 Tax=Nocardia acididurans TaxID=2802282 RepID=A0ABS1M9Z0_9NOCA|nr:CocE/NonD family hydrolase [Nocardia acididurans]MBL1075983.1 CocE/NonD family hydrolase [Nocardia acididurans]
MRSGSRARLAGKLAAAAVAAVLGTSLLVQPASGDPAGDFTGIDGGTYAAGWTAAVDGPQPYNGIAPDLAVPITMSDGTVLKADIIHPADNGRVPDTRRPVVLQMQGYGKMPMLIGQALLSIPGIQDVLLPWLASLNLPGVGLDGIFDMTRQLDSGAVSAAIQDWALAHAGYTLVQVDIRGTGTSEGKWQVFGEREKQDMVEVIDWITRQSWSDGNVGTMGISFTGISAMEVADRNPPGLKAIFAYEPSADIFTDIAGSGGAVGAGFLVPWLIGVNFLKMIPDVEALLVGKFDPAQQLEWLRDRIADPAVLVDKVLNGYTAMAPSQLTPSTQEIYDPESGFRQGLKIDPSKVEVPTFVVDAWWDLFGSTPTDTYNTMPLPLEQKKLIMGEGYHLGSGVAGFGHPGMPPRLDVLQRAWFDKWLRGIDNGIDRYSPLTLKQQGGGWVTSLEYPNNAITYRRMYLNDIPSGTTQSSLYDGGLSAAPPATPRDLTVAPGVLSLCSRDAARIAAGIVSIIQACGDDSRIWEMNGLTFTSAPVAEPTTISGAINMHLNVVHDAADGYWVVTLNDVAPDGASREITTGQLVSSLRQIDDAASLKSPNGDYTQPAYYLDMDRRQPTVPGEAVTLDIAMTPMEAVLAPGHRLRIDVYASNFPKGVPILPILVDSGLKPQHVRLDPNAPSWVNIPLSAAVPE